MVSFVSPHDAAWTDFFAKSRRRTRRFRRGPWSRADAGATVQGNLCGENQNNMFAKSRRGEIVSQRCSGLAPPLSGEFSERPMREIAQGPTRRMHPSKGETRDFERRLISTTCRVIPMGGEATDIETTTHKGSMPVGCRLIHVGGKPATLARRLMPNVLPAWALIERAGDIPIEVRRSRAAPRGRLHA